MKNLLFFIFILIGSLFFMPKKDNSYKKSMAVIDEYSNYIKNKYKVEKTMYGLNYSGEDKVYDGKIHVIALGYSSDPGMKYEEARKHFYMIVDGLLEHINKNPHIGQYFFHYPVDYSDLKIHLSFDRNQESMLKKDEVHSIHVVRNQIFYEIVNEEGPNEIEKDQVSPDIYIMKGILERNRSIIRTVQEDLAMHSK